LVSINIQQATVYVSGCHFFHTFSSHALPCQTPFYKTAPLLPSVARQQNVMEYWWEGSTCTAISPTSASGVVGQRYKIGGMTFGAALLLLQCLDGFIFILVKLK